MKIEEYIKSLPNDIISGNDVQLPEHSFRKIFEFLNLNENDVFYHLGCGDGKGIKIALQEFHVKKAIGVDNSKEKIQQAKNELLNKLNKKDEFFYRMMSFIYLKEKNYKKAAEYLKSLYALNHNKKTLLQLVDILIKNKQFNEAMAYLRTHLNMYGCEYDVCLRAAIIYKQTYDYENLASIYEKMGQFDNKYVMFALRIYLDSGKYKKALKLIDKYHLGDEYRLIVYESEKNYKKAAFYAKKLYEESAKLPYLLKYCTYLYQANPTKESIKEIVLKLKYLLKFYNSAYLYNFLGYILIDKDINVKEGLKYVQKALELKPDNEEYIDSLAWGYYKLGKCKEALEIISKKFNVKLTQSIKELFKKKINHKTIVNKEDIKRAVSEFL